MAAPQTADRSAATPRTVEVFAHRGSSGLHPEMTLGAFVAAIELARERGVRLGLECDVHFTADGELGCLHDATLERTAGDSHLLVDCTIAELSQLDFGSWRGDLAETAALSDQDRQFVTLRQLFELVRTARAEGVDVHLAVETKHPVPRDAEVEQALVDLLVEFGWDVVGAPVRMITFDAEAILRLRAALPDLAVSYLIDRYEAWPHPAITTDMAIGASARLLAGDPELATRVARAGHECHVWTVNEPEHIAYALELGLTALTTDHPERVLDALGGLA